MRAKCIDHAGGKRSLCVIGKAHDQTGEGLLQGRELTDIDIFWWRRILRCTKSSKADLPLNQPAVSRCLMDICQIAHAT